jgi:hypothetical protein
MPTNVPAPVPVASFDYTALEPDAAQFVREKTERIQKLMKRTVEDFAQIGGELIAIKGQLEHGQFSSWLDTYFPWGERTAEECMNLYRHPKTAKFADLGLGPSVARILSAPSTPEAVSDEVIALAEAGEKVDVKRTKQIKKKYVQQEQKTLHRHTSSFQQEPPTSTVEVVDAPIESLPSQQEAHKPPSPTPEREAVLVERVPEPNEVKALPPSPREQWWRLSGFEQTHLLFCGHPDSTEFLLRLPACVGIWMGFPPNPNQWLCPPPNRVNTAFSYSTIYPNIDLKAVREAVERVLETSDESDLSAIVAYLPDPPLVVLLEDFQITCYIAEPDMAQCQKILSVWQQLGGTVSQLENLDAVDSSPT